MKLSSSRRRFFGIVASLAASLALPRRMFGAKAAESSPKLAGFGQSGNPYDELGVPTVINAEGTMTVLGGSLGRPNLRQVSGLLRKCRTEVKFDPRDLFLELLRGPDQALALELLLRELERSDDRQIMIKIDPRELRDLIGEDWESVSDLIGED